MGLQKELGSGDSLATLLDPWEAGEPQLRHLPDPLFSLLPNVVYTYFVGKLFFWLLTLFESIYFLKA